MKDEASLLQDDATLHAYVDGRLDAATRATVQAQLEAEPDAAQRVHAWQDQKEMLQLLHRELLADPVPPLLLNAARQLHHRSARFDRWQRWGGIAASVLVAFACGWGANVQWKALQDAGTFGIAKSRAVNQFARQALVAYTVYTPEVRHPVEVEATQQQHLVQWLSKRLNRPLKVPNLSEQGYELVGGRLLPGDNGARAQFMFQSAGGDRITLYVGALDGKAGSSATETAFRYENDGGVSSFYWVEQGFGYALTGKTPRARLLVLAEAVYKQL